MRILLSLGLLVAVLGTAPAGEAPDGAAALATLRTTTATAQERRIAWGTLSRFFGVAPGSAKEATSPEAAETVLSQLLPLVPTVAGELAQQAASEEDPHLLRFTLAGPTATSTAAVALRTAVLDVLVAHLRDGRQRTWGMRIHHISQELRSPFGDMSYQERKPGPDQDALRQEIVTVLWPKWSAALVHLLDAEDWENEFVCDVIGQIGMRDHLHPFDDTAICRALVARATRHKHCDALRDAATRFIAGARWLDDDAVSFVATCWDEVPSDREHLLDLADPLATAEPLGVRFFRGVVVDRLGNPRITEVVWRLATPPADLRPAIIDRLLEALPAITQREQPPELAALRSLRAHPTCYQGLLDETRRARLRTLAGDRDLRIATIAAWIVPRLAAEGAAPAEISALADTLLPRLLGDPNRPIGSFEPEAQMRDATLKLFLICPRVELSSASRDAATTWLARRGSGGEIEHALASLLQRSGVTVPPSQVPQPTAPAPDPASAPKDAEVADARKRPLALAQLVRQHLDWEGAPQLAGEVFGAPDEFAGYALLRAIVAAPGDTTRFANAARPFIDRVQEATTSQHPLAQQDEQTRADAARLVAHTLGDRARALQLLGEMKRTEQAQERGGEPTKWSPRLEALLDLAPDDPEVQAYREAIARPTPASNALARWLLDLRSGKPGAFPVDGYRAIVLERRDDLVRQLAQLGAVARPYLNQLRDPLALNEEENSESGALLVTIEHLAQGGTSPR